MKNSLNLVLVILFFVVLGCSCPKVEELAKQVNNSNSTTSNTSTPSTDASPANSNSALTKEKYDQIKNGMTKAEVEKILGGQGEEMSSSSAGGYSFAMYAWKGENYSSITVMFSNNKVSSKSQYGVK